ncbi:MAG: 50S ribosomal protein L30e [Candidatus Bathyarchaeota archaeon]|nr:MAG: 50S ribosomal protein L30e [Candidatus Bathyarchaeota archaeon]
MDINKAIATAIRTGKVLIGAKSALESVKTGKARLIIVATNCPQKTREDIAYYCGLSDIPLIAYNGTSVDMGAVCGKSFMVSVLTLREPGDSEILKLSEVANV